MDAIVMVILLLDYSGINMDVTYLSSLANNTAFGWSQSCTPQTVIALYVPRLRYLRHTKSPTHEIADTIAHVVSCLFRIFETARLLTIIVYLTKMKLGLFVIIARLVYRTLGGRKLITLEVETTTTTTTTTTSFIFCRLLNKQITIKRVHHGTLQPRYWLAKSAGTTKSPSFNTVRTYKFIV